jgi:hypothetical protein
MDTSAAFLSVSEAFENRLPPSAEPWHRYQLSAGLLRSALPPLPSRTEQESINLPKSNIE